MLFEDEDDNVGMIRIMMLIMIKIMMIMMLVIMIRIMMTMMMMMIMRRDFENWIGWDDAVEKM